MDYDRLIYSEYFLFCEIIGHFFTLQYKNTIDKYV